MKHLTVLHTLALACAASLPAAATAGISSEGGGDYGAVPLYRALTFGGIDRGGDGTYDFADVDGLDYASNVAPRNASTFASFNANGATLSTSGWAAYSGFYAARDVASMTVTNANAADTYYLVAGQGTATSVRFYSDDVAAQSATFTFHISGSESNPNAIGRSTSRLDFAANTDPDKNWIDLFTGNLQTLSVFGAGTYTYTLPTLALGTDISLYFWTSAFTQVNAGDAAQGSNFTITADYGHTFVLDSVQLLDANQAPLNDWAMEDAFSGELLFNQDGRQTPLLPPPAIPEPGTWALLVAGLALVARAARRRGAGALPACAGA